MEDESAFRASEWPAMGEPSEVFSLMSDSDVERALLSLERDLNAVSLWFHHAIAEYDRRGIAEREYVLTTRQWLRRFCRMTGSAASTAVRVARSLRNMPIISKVGRDGDLTPEAVRRLASAQHEHPEHFPLHELVFADIASYLDPADLRAALAHWRQQIEGSSGVVDEAEDRVARRRLAISQTYEGMWHQEGLLDPESGQVVSTALRSLADPPNLDPDDDRTHGQRMVDAAVDICRFWLDHNQRVVSFGGVKPHVTVTVDYEAVVGASRALPEIDGTPIPAHTLRRILCDAGVTRVVVDGEGQPLDVGRTVRTVTAPIRRGLDLRDGGCTWEGCDAPAGWCDAHHIEHWADGGPTSLANMVLLCRRHHTATHEGRSPKPRPMCTGPPDP